MRIVFMGTPSFAADILEKVVQYHEVIAVYTRPDAVRSRGKRLDPSPVKECALQHGIEVFTPQSLRDVEVQHTLAALEPDVICVAAYGAILPIEVLEVPRFACLNVHGSLLPRWRGAAPIERAILAGDKEIGVCVMRMEEGLDTGAYCACRATQTDDKNLDTLTVELADLGAQALLTALDRLEQGNITWIDQDESQVTYADKISKHELDLSPRKSAIENVRNVRASSMAHPSRAIIAGRSVSVIELQVFHTDVEKPLVSGEVRYVSKHLLLGTDDGIAEVILLKPDGKKTMDAQAFAAGIQGIKQGGLIWEACLG